MMFETVEWTKATYFTGRNGTYDQMGIEVSTDTTMRASKSPDPQPGIALVPVSNRGIAKCTITIPLSHIDKVIRLLKKAKKELKDAQGKVAKTREPVAKAGTDADSHQHGTVEEVRDVPVQPVDQLAESQS
jgi:hypothetical protein